MSVGDALRTVEKNGQFTGGGVTKIDGEGLKEQGL
jgi:hypothetical protein